jgi:hypothetical protein
MYCCDPDERCKSGSPKVCLPQMESEDQITTEKRRSIPRYATSELLEPGRPIQIMVGKSFAMIPGNKLNPAI